MSARATGGATGSTDAEGPELEGDLVAEDEVDPFEDDEEDPDQDLEEELDEDLDGEGEGEEVDAPEAGLEELAAGDDGDDEAEPAVTVVPPDAEFDDDAPVAVVEDEEVDEEIEGLRDGEFVCRGCFMAKRETQLADADALLCRDCA